MFLSAKGWSQYNVISFFRPSAFEDHSKTTSGGIIPDDMLPPSDDSDNEEMSGVVVNANRPVYVESDEESEDESEDDGS